MKRTLLLMTLTLAVGLATGMGGGSDAECAAARDQEDRAAPDRCGVEDKEAVVFMAEIPPGVVTGKHRHPGNELIYVLEGSYVLEVDGKGAIPLKAGEARHAPPGEVHAAKSLGSPRPSKVLVFLIAEKGQPLAIPVQ